MFGGNEEFFDDDAVIGEQVFGTDDDGFEPPLIDEPTPGVAGDYKTLNDLKAKEADNNKAEDKPDEKAPDAPAETKSLAETAAAEGEAPAGDATAEEEFDVPDPTNWSEKAVAEIKDQLDLFGVKPEMISKREDFEFVQDQFAFVKEKISEHEGFIQIVDRESMPDADFLAQCIQDKYGAEEDEDELLTRTAKFFNEEGELNERGKRYVASKRTEDTQVKEKIVEELKVASRQHATQQYHFYKEVEKRVKEFQPSGFKFRVGTNDLELTEVPKVPVAQRRILKAFVESDYLAQANAQKIPEGKTKAELVAENAFWLNEKLRGPYIGELLKKAYEQGQSDLAAKNFK